MVAQDYQPTTTITDRSPQTLAPAYAGRPSGALDIAAVIVTVLMVLGPMVPMAIAGRNAPAGQSADRPATGAAVQAPETSGPAPTSTGTPAPTK